MALGGENKKKNNTTGSSSTLRGCIKKTKGPWLVGRTNKNGVTVTKLRFPTEKERQQNKQRERQRRLVTRNIFAGLKEHGNYDLPKHADTNDLLKALCDEAGWYVEPDGTIHRKNNINANISQSNDQDFCTCNNQGTLLSLGLGHSDEGRDIDLMLSLSVSSSSTPRV